MWYAIPGTSLAADGVEVNWEGISGYCTYSGAKAGSTITYSAVVDRDGFVCARIDLPKRNDFHVLINGVERYRDNISLPQMTAVGEVRAGDLVEIRVACGTDKESGSATVDLAILDNELFRLGHAMLSQSVLELTSFSNLRVEGTINCNREGLLYTSIPQNGNWVAYVDGREAEITLIGDCMIGLRMTKGIHRVEFVYRNLAFTLGAAVSIASAALLILLTVLTRRRKKKAEVQEFAIQEQPESLPLESEAVAEEATPVSEEAVQPEEPEQTETPDTPTE